MQGYNALWQPGTDHASIATEVKVIQALKEQGINKADPVSYTHLDVYKRQLLTVGRWFKSLSK